MLLKYHSSFICFLNFSLVTLVSQIKAEVNFVDQEKCLKISLNMAGRMPAVVIDNGTGYNIFLFTCVNLVKLLAILYKNVEAGSVCRRNESESHISIL